MPKAREKAEPVARANGHVCHASCWRTSRASHDRGSSVTFGKSFPMSTTPQFDPEPRNVWRRKNYDPSLLTGSRRDVAERETARDLDKPFAQLLCDVHEESLDPARTPEQNIAGAQKRMVSLMLRVAETNDQVARRMLWLTWAIVGMTAVLLIVTVLMWLHEK
jgi:hypothetical protein